MLLGDKLTVRRLGTLSAALIFLLTTAQLQAAEHAIDSGHQAEPQQASRKKISTQAELPQFTYPVGGTLEQLLESPTPEFLKFALPVRADIEKTLAAYDISDHATVVRLLEAEAGADLIEGGHDEQALQVLEKESNTIEKPAEKFIRPLAERTFLRARLASGKVADGTCPKDFTSLLQGELKPLDWSAVEPGIKLVRYYSQVATPNFFEGRAAGEVGEASAKTHTLTLLQAAFVINARAEIAYLVPCRQQSLRVLTAYQQANAHAKAAIWQARDIVFRSEDKLAPVNVVIWDSGVDLSLFSGRVYNDPHPAAQADAHGIASDVQRRPTHGSLIPLTPEQQAAYPEMAKTMEASGDVGAGIDSPAADAIKARVAAMPPADVKKFFNQLDAFSSYAHGTHVAGIAARGNPAIRIAYARMTFDTAHPRQTPGDELSKRQAAEFARDVAWFKTHGIRVVNMSWWDRPSNFEVDLAEHGIGKDDADRKVIAQHLFGIERDALYTAIKNAPGVLFVTIAGNNNVDNSFEECSPSSFILPNLIVAGAVDEAGKEANFTSYGANVAVHAWGVGVPSIIPGGKIVKMSGTSMAAPQVTNLAAKLLAMDPSLTPAQVISLIRDGADTSADGRRHLMNPMKSLQLLRQQQRPPQAAIVQ